MDMWSNIAASTQVISTIATQVLVWPLCCVLCSAPSSPTALSNLCLVCSQESLAQVCANIPRGISRCLIF